MTVASGRLKSLYVSWLGEKPYEEVWAWQEQVRTSMLQRPQNGRVLLVQHPPTISIGRGESGENLSQGKEELIRAGFDVVETNRGGKVTYHGPGQLVAYPIIHLASHQLGVRDYVYLLEQTMIDSLGRVGVTAHRRDGFPGVWVGIRKIGSIGIHIRKQVSIHGLALNISPNLSHFDVITPCGISGVQMTSAEQEGVDITVEQMIEPFLDAFRKSFGCELFLQPWVMDSSRTQPTKSTTSPVHV